MSRETASDRDYDHASEYKLWLAAEKAEQKARELSLLSYVKRYRILECLDSDMARVHTAIEWLGEQLANKAVRDEIETRAAARTRDFPRVDHLPRSQGLQLTLRAAPGPRLAAALARDRFQCIADEKSDPQIYLGTGVLDEYRRLVEHPDVVAASKVAEGTVRGRALTPAVEAGSPDPAAGGDLPAPDLPDGDQPSPTADGTATATDEPGPSPQPATPTPKRRQRDPRYVQPPEGVPLPQLMLGAAGDPLLLEVIGYEGKIDQGGLFRHLRGSYGQVRIEDETKKKIQARLTALVARDDGRLVLDAQGRYCLSSLDPARPADPGEGAPPGLDTVAGAVSGAGGDILLPDPPAGRPVREADGTSNDGGASGDPAPPDASERTDPSGPIIAPMPPVGGDEGAGVPGPA